MFIQLHQTVSRIFLFIILLFTLMAEAAPPTRTQTYSSLEVIKSSEVTENENNLYNYLTAGVDTYSDGSIVNADISSSANIQSEKLNLQSIAQAVAITSSGSFDNNGATSLDGTNTFTGATTISGIFATTGTSNTIGNGGSDVLTLNVPGGMTLSAATTWTLTGALSFSGTIADLGTVTTANIDGGTLDGVQVGGTTATGELLVNDSSDDADGLGSQGTTGQVLTSAGTGANPTWANQDLELISSNSGTTAGASTGRIVLAASKQYYITFELSVDEATAGTVDMRFYNSGSQLSGASDYAWSFEEVRMNTTPTVTNTGDDADTEITLTTAMATNANNGFVKGEMWISTYKFGTAYSAFATWRGLIRNSTPEFRNFDGAGLVVGNYTINGFDMGLALGAAALSMTYRINVYELTQS